MKVALIIIGSIIVFNIVFQLSMASCYAKLKNNREGGLEKTIIRNLRAQQLVIVGTTVYRLSLVVALFVLGMGIGQII